MKCKLSLLFLILCFQAVMLSGQQQKSTGQYDLTQPSLTVRLPSLLAEISGITLIDSSLVACIQDEAGVIFFFDMHRNQVVRTLVFAGPGDYEGIALAGKALFVLRSDGVLYEIPDFTSAKANTRYYDTKIPASNNEGLCFDSRNNRLLIACKEGYKDDEVKNRQLVYSFDLKTRKISNDPVLSVDIREVRKYVNDHGIRIPGVDKDETDKIGFKASDIAVNPVSGRIYIISASDNILLYTDPKGKTERVEPLKKELFRQAEGIAFSRQGDMYISNEAAGKDPVILRFNLRKK